MKITAKIKFRYKSEEWAEVAYKSLEPDNIGFIDSCYMERYLICRLNGNSIGTLLATADDLLSCERMVERVGRTVSNE